MALTIRGTEPFIESFKELTGEKTAAGALVEAAKIGVSASAELAATKQALADTQRALARYKQVIGGLQNVCAQVAELAGQKDMFDTERL